MKLAVTLFGILLTAFTTILTYWSRTKFTQTQLARHPRLRKLFHRRQIQLSFVITMSVILSAICTAALVCGPMPRIRRAFQAQPMISQKWRRTALSSMRLGSILSRSKLPCGITLEALSVICWLVITKMRQSDLISATRWLRP